MKHIKKFNESNTVNFKKGDSVICDDYGIGFVISINSGNKTYPIEVEFQSDNSRVLYTEDGSESINYPPTLKKSNHDWRP